MQEQQIGTKHKLKIKMTITDEEGNITEKLQEVDVGLLKDAHQAEREAIALGKERDAFVMENIIKKKKMSKWRKLWWRIRTLFGMGRKKYK